MAYSRCWDQAPEWLRRRLCPFGGAGHRGSDALRLGHIDQEEFGCGVELPLDSLAIFFVPVQDGDVTALLADILCAGLAQTRGAVSSRQTRSAVLHAQVRKRSLCLTRPIL